MIMRVRGVVLPEREECTFWVDGERLRTEAILRGRVVR